MKIPYTRIEVLQSANDKLFFKDKWTARITSIALHRSHEVLLGVSWSSIGAVTAEEAREVAEQMETCSEIASRINALHLEWEMVDDTLITDEETYYKFVDLLVDAFKHRKYDQIDKFFSLGNNYDNPEE